MPGSGPVPPSCPHLWPRPDTQPMLWPLEWLAGPWAGHASSLRPPFFTSINSQLYFGILLLAQAFVPQKPFPTLPILTLWHNYHCSHQTALESPVSPSQWLGLGNSSPSSFNSTEMQSTRRERPWGCSKSIQAKQFSQVPNFILKNHAEKNPR